MRRRFRSGTSTIAKRRTEPNKTAFDLRVPQRTRQGSSIQLRFKDREPQLWHNGVTAYVRAY